MSGSNLKEAFSVEAKYGPFYTGGNVKWTNDGEHLVCQNGESLSILSVDKGVVVTKLGGSSENSQDEDTINSFTLSEDGKQVISHHKSGLFKMWSLDGKLEKLWKSIHTGPVPQIALTSSNEIMASGGTDSSIRLWNLQYHSCTFNLQEIQGVTSVLEFHPKLDLIFASGDNSKIQAWDITTGELKLSLSGHFSKVTSLSFHEDNIHMVSSARDKVLILWNIEKAASLRVLPVYESLESTFILPSNINFPNSDLKKSDGIYAAAAGEKGVVKIWELTKGCEIYSQKNSLVPASQEEGGLSITRLLFNSKLQAFGLATVDHNIIIHSIENFECLKQFVGYSDEILDIVHVGQGETHLAVATNSCDIKLYHLETMSCQLLRAHTDLVLSLSTSPANQNLMVSSSKDNSVRLWLMCSETKKMSCIGKGVRHTASIGSVSFSKATASFFVSVSQDSCLKLWNLPDKISKKSLDLTLDASNTVLAHQKDINCVTVSPNDKLIATGSQDKTAKLWSAENLKLLGVFHGHRRGVWCVRFSPIDQVLLTTSADSTMKLWSLTELNCLKTFEGHDSSVLRAEFLSRGMQIITSSGDGLLKLWSIKKSECVTTLEEHESRVWALSVSSKEDKIISGASDSLLVVWKDVTEENREKLAAEQEKLILEEQKLANLLKSNDLIAALKLGLKLEKPSLVLNIIQNIIKIGEDNLRDSIDQLKIQQKDALLRCASTWNMNGRNSHVAQLVINALLNDIKSGNLKENHWASTLETLIPYSERHFTRISKLLQDLHFLNYTTTRIKPHT